MNQISNHKQFDLEDRTLKFSDDCRRLIKNIKKSIANFEDGKQLIRSSGSVGANYIEANESLSKKDFIMRIKISKKEAKESRYWLKLIDIENNQGLERKRKDLINEATELMKIFGSILENSK
ncbi:MAG: four helix bundle protein [Patescibacteria group bacterium]|jgi:four helix bundle protein